MTTFHVPGLPGQPVSRDNSSCAYTQKVRRFAQMMRERGHRVVVYGIGDDVAELVEVESPQLPFEASVWADYNAACAAAIRGQADRGDVLGMIAGVCQAALADALVHLAPVEFGIGYGGVCAPYRVFESYAWMHLVLGASNPDPHQTDGRMTDAVIPNYFDVDEFPEGRGAGGYVLYLGRLIERKGVHLAAAAAQEAGVPLILAGAGDAIPAYGEPIGPIGPDERAELLGDALAVVSPTVYVEPFGGAAVEGMLCGTPAITSDWGAFTETVWHGVTGYRCHTIDEMAAAIAKAGELDRDEVRSHAISRYSLEAVGPQYETYFDRVLSIEAPTVTLMGGDS